MGATMRTIGAREANQQFSRLLREVEQGVEITITRNGEPVAKLSPLNAQRDAKKRAAAWRRMSKLMDKGLNLGGRGWTRDEMHED
jgi:prevent-host-death family protein